MDNSRVGVGELVAGVGGLVLLLSLLFFNWYVAKAEQAGVKLEVGISASDAFGLIYWILFIVAIVAIIAAIASALGAAANVPLGRIVAVLGIIATVLVLFRIVALPNEVTLDPSNTEVDAPSQIKDQIESTLDDEDSEEQKVDDIKDDGDFNRGFGLWIGLLASAGIAFGGFASRSPGGGGAPPPPATPAAAAPPPGGAPPA